MMPTPWMFFCIFPAKWLRLTLPTTNPELKHKGFLVRFSNFLAGFLLAVQNGSGIAKRQQRKFASARQHVCKHQEHPLGIARAQTAVELAAVEAAPKRSAW